MNGRPFDKLRANGQITRQFKVVRLPGASTPRRRALLWRKLMDDLRQELSDLVQKIDSVVERL